MGTTTTLHPGQTRFMRSCRRDTDGTTVPIAHDASGRLVDDGRFTYTYDIKNRLVAVRQAGVVVEAYAYDAASRLVAAFDGTGLKERFVYDGAQMVAAFDATGAPR